MAAAAAVVENVFHTIEHQMRRSLTNTYTLIHQHICNHDEDDDDVAPKSHFQMAHNFSTKTLTTHTIKMKSKHKDPRTLDPRWKIITNIGNRRRHYTKWTHRTGCIQGWTTQQSHSPHCVQLRKNESKSSTACARVANVGIFIVIEETIGADFNVIFFSFLLFSWKIVWCSEWKRERER